MHPTAKEEGGGGGGGGGEGKIRYLWERYTFFLTGPVFMEDAFECYFSRWEKGGEKGEKRRREKKGGRGGVVSILDEALTSNVLISGILKSIAAPRPAVSYTRPFLFFWV